MRTSGKSTLKNIDPGNTGGGSTAKPSTSSLRNIDSAASPLLGHSLLTPQQHAALGPTPSTAAILAMVAGSAAVGASGPRDLLHPVGLVIPSPGSHHPNHPNQQLTVCRRTTGWGASPTAVATQQHQMQILGPAQSHALSIVQDASKVAREQLQIEQQQLASSAAAANAPKKMSANSKQYTVQWLDIREDKQII